MCAPERKAMVRDTRNIREALEEREERFLHPKAALAKKSKGRVRDERECDMRTCFQRDRDRIIHCKSFRRLKHKTQVFLAPAGDHYRTRLTHTLEVSQVARSISRSLCLNEDLTEAISLAHDLGHTPFGHAGERVLNGLMPGGFHHNIQSLRVADELEYDGKGLNLTFEVRDGILKHSKGETEILSDDMERKPATLEGEVVRLSDVIAYVNHDLDDALRAGIIRMSDIPQEALDALGGKSAKRIDTLIKDVVFTSLDDDLRRIRLSEKIMRALVLLRSFLFERVYENDQSRKEFKKAEKMLMEIYREIMKTPENYLADAIQKERAKKRATVRNDEDSDYDSDLTKEEIERLAFDFIAGMTDRYAIALFEKLFVPSRWSGVDTMSIS